MLRLNRVLVLFLIRVNVFIKHLMMMVWFNWWLFVHSVDFITSPTSCICARLHSISLTVVLSLILVTRHLFFSLLGRCTNDICIISLMMILMILLLLRYQYVIWSFAFLYVLFVLEVRRTHVFTISYESLSFSGW